MNALSLAVILFIGDSHSVGPFGHKLDELLRSNPQSKVRTQAACGSIPGWWYSGQSTSCGAFGRGMNGKIITEDLKYPTPKILTLLKEVKPTTTILEFGGNYDADFRTVGGPERVKKDMIRIANDVVASGSKCVWVTLPKTRTHASTEKALVDLIIKSVSDKCMVINSLELIDHFPLKGCNDGTHYSCKEGIPIANKWAEQVYSKITSAK